MYAPWRFRGRILGTAGDPANLEKFWQGAHMDTDPRLQRHPLRNNEMFHKLCVPCGLHGDAVPYKKAEPGASLKVTSWTSLLGQGGSTWDTHFLWDAVPSGFGCKAEKHGVDTEYLRTIVLRWDWECALRGVYPDRDPFNQPWPADSLRARRSGMPIASGHFLGLLQLRADILHQCNEWNFKRYGAEVPRKCLVCEVVLSWFELLCCRQRMKCV